MMASIGGFPGQGPHPVPYAAVDLERSEFTFGRVVECTCDHRASLHDFDDGRQGMPALTESRCLCEWYP